ncbi:hypothetical protein AFE_3091 [Acidithiobacillus ferrooxidans ATCC 23270]|uniref:Uncharacterized protein n=1 Tax=Acidithiobacillus ferrooxidans (strain ATCC 23270 / DSM 14882 / CIP 104768 / NCIMB 8455) TaxID=243159 RepID=B7JAJ5_ACIF2|nr:hypothetical protein AFE_3091 [Acidithiobacillus ferrooxidans ATCC 23270]
MALSVAGRGQAIPAALIVSARLRPQRAGPKP